MRKPLLWLAVLCLGGGLCVAQSGQPDKVCEVHLNRVKPGMVAQYEQGRAKHMAWHKSQNDSWSWNTWEITTGENTGNYLITSCGHAWKDMDGRQKFGVDDNANAQATMGDSLAAETMSYYVLRPDASATPKPDVQPPYLSVTFFHLKPEGYTDFTNGIKQVNEAYTKTNTPRLPFYWYSLANGGHGPEMVLVQERNNLEDMQPKSSKTLDEIMKEAFGDGNALMALRRAYYGTDSELLHYRADLSYNPGK